MTFALFISLFLALFIAVLNFLPTAAPLSPAVSSGFVLVIGFMKEWNWLFPITELFICVGVVLSYEILFWSWRALLGTAHLIRGTQSGS